MYTFTFLNRSYNLKYKKDNSSFIQNSCPWYIKTASSYSSYINLQHQPANLETVSYKILISTTIQTAK